ncbi:uncharacterized protein QC761_115858 [Podospora bellae-mahoneyi]|uniref:HSF-type DNA-binding domain-containing protein n=1 Tax=Podospora bellae-mahoneyi TaxID=2093777 RepID=A0ABR0G053_9PEZI|nr:hypothetical protein QC761_115858 [Podospora bellae-mahoneyi]
MGPPIPISQAARKVYNGIEYFYGFPNSEQVFVLNLNTKLRMFTKTNAWGTVSRSEFKEYISLYPRLYQVANTSRDRIQQWLHVGYNRANFESWGPDFRAFLRTEAEDQSTNTRVRKPGIPPQAKWLNEEHKERGAAFDIRMGRQVQEEEGDDSVMGPEDEEEVTYQPDEDQNGGEEDVEQARSHVNSSQNGTHAIQQPRKRRREEQSTSTLVGTPFPESMAHHYQLANSSQQQFALRELRNAATGFRTLHSEVLRVAQKLEPGDFLRPLLSHIANSTTLEVGAAENAARISSELMDHVAKSQAEGGRSGDDEDRIKRARSRAAYEMLPTAAPANRLPRRRSQQQQANHPSIIREDSQAPKADDNVRSLTVPRERSLSLGYELPDHLAEAYQPLFEPSSPIYFGPLNSLAGEASSRPNTAKGAQSNHPHNRGTPAPVPGASSYHREASIEEFRPPITARNTSALNGPQGHPSQAQTAAPHSHHMPVNSIEVPGYLPYHANNKYRPPSQPHSTVSYASGTGASSLHRHPAVVEPAAPPPAFSPPNFGPANCRSTRQANRELGTAQRPNRELPPPATTISTRQTRQSSQQPTLSSSSASHAPLRATAGQPRQATRGNQKGKTRRRVEVEDEDEDEKGQGNGVE